MIKNYFAKGFYIIENESKQLSLFPNDVKFKINIINQIDTDFFMARNKAISDVANTIKNRYSEKYAFDLQTRLL